MAMIPNKHIGLFTDHYELTMAQGYFFNGKKDMVANFDYFFRKLPFDGGYVVFAGLRDLLELLEQFKFDQEDCEYLASLGFHADFLKYLKSFRFNAKLFAPDEGTLVFPNEPIVRICGNLIECQIVETLVLNILNFESLIATKASRIKQAAGDKLVMDFGLRRSQGLGGIYATRAAIIGGVDATSNLFSAKKYELEATGTQAHSWIQSFEDEIEAFRVFARIYPEKSILLVDTYDTLKSGVSNAIVVAKEMEQRGERLFGIRLDSGDLAYLSKRARKMLNDEGLHYVIIAVSNQLDEHVIKSLLDQKAPIDAFGVGTSLVTGRKDAALDGVYKLSMADNKSRLKISDNIEKIILPGSKQILRTIDNEGKFYGDCIILEEEKDAARMFHPNYPFKSVGIGDITRIHLLKLTMNKGEILLNKNTEAATMVLKEQFKLLHDEHKRFANPHVYKVGVSKNLLELRDALIFEAKEKIQKAIYQK
jgi:nicotinate phosphoribosyltransferase